MPFPSVQPVLPLTTEKLWALLEKFLNDLNLDKLKPERTFREELEERKTIEKAATFNNARFRISFFLQQDKPAVAIRILPEKIFSFEEIFIPDVIPDVKATIDKPEGLVLVTGPTGAGKTTTLSTFLSFVLQKLQPKHIITIEDPIEFVYPHEHYPGVISQKEVGRDVESFEEGTIRALRQMPGCDHDW